MRYTSSLESRVQQGKGDTNPQHDVVKLRLDKGRYLYFVPSVYKEGKYEFCSNDEFVQRIINRYDTQLVKKRFQFFQVRDKIQTDLGIPTENSRGTSTNHPENVPQVPLSQSRLAKEIRAKKLQTLELQTFNQLCQRLGYECFWTDIKTHEYYHSNPNFEGNLYLRDKQSGKDYFFSSELVGNKKNVQWNICNKIFAGIQSNSNTAGEPTPKQQNLINQAFNNRTLAEQQLREHISAEQKRFYELQQIFTAQKQQLIKGFLQDRTDVENLKKLQATYNELYKAGDEKFFLAFDKDMEQQPKIAEVLTKTMFEAYGFKDAATFFKDHHDCLKYVRKEFDESIEPGVMEKIAKMKALDEIAPTTYFDLDINDGAYSSGAYYHALDKNQAGKWTFVGSFRDWKKLNALQDEDGKPIEESSAMKHNGYIKSVYGVNLYEEITPTAEQKAWAKNLYETQKQKRENQEKIEKLRAEKNNAFYKENGIDPSSEDFKEVLRKKISEMEVIRNKDNKNQTGLNREYTLKNAEGKEYLLKITDNESLSSKRTLKIEFDSFSLSTEQHSGSLTKKFAHELKMAVRAGHPNAEIIDAALRTVGILGDSETIKKKIRNGELTPVKPVIAMGATLDNY